MAVRSSSDRILLLVLAATVGACAPAKSSFKLGPWLKVPSEGDGQLAVDGMRIVVGGERHVVVWDGERRLASVEAKAASPGVPRLIGNTVLHGPGVIDIGSGELLLRDSVVPPVLRYGRGDVALSYAWSPDGNRLVVTLRGGQPPRTKVVLYDGASGSALTTLLEDAVEAPPTAVWVGKRATLIGFPNPVAFDLSTGHEISPVLLTPAVPLTQIDATRDEKLVITVARGGNISLIDGESFALLDTWDGAWTGGGISSDGRYVVAADSAKRALHVACVDPNRRLRDIGTVEIDPRHAASLALGDGRVALVGGGSVLSAKLAVDCRRAK